MNRQDSRNARGLGEPASEVDAVASAVLEAAFAVHRVLGPGFFEGLTLASPASWRFLAIACDPMRPTPCSFR
jgi:hypothetical protein